MSLGGFSESKVVAEHHAADCWSCAGILTSDRDLPLRITSPYSIWEHQFAGHDVRPVKEEK